MNPSKKITLVNVCPIKFDKSIIKVLHEIGVRTTSAVLPLKSVLALQNYSHTSQVLEVRSISTLKTITSYLAT